MLRHLLLSVIAIIAIATAARAQSGYTTVTATVQDSAGTLYVNAPFTVVFVDPGTSGKLPTLNKSPFQQSYVGFATDSNGKLSISLPDNSVIASGSGATGTQWRFSICTAVGTYTTQFCIPAVTLTISGASQDISASLTAVAPILPTTLVNFAQLAHTWSQLQTFSLGITSSGPNTLNGGGTMGGTYAGTPTWSGLHTFSVGLTSAGPNTLNGGGTTAGTWTNSGAWTFNNTVTSQSVVPTAVNTYTLGTQLLPWLNVAIGSAGNVSTLIQTNAVANRTATFPDATLTVAGSNIAQTWSGNQTNMTLVTPNIGAATGTSLNLGATGVLSTTAQSGTGSLCMTTNCALTTPTIGGGSTITKYALYSFTIGSSTVNANACSTVTYTVTGLSTSDKTFFAQAYSATPTNNTSAVWPAAVYASGANTLSIVWCNAANVNANISETGTGWIIAVQ